VASRITIRIEKLPIHVWKIPKTARLKKRAFSFLWTSASRAFIIFMDSSRSYNIETVRALGEKTSKATKEL
jgi:hypothetical protein